jgi:hypothetical protein
MTNNEQVLLKSQAARSSQLAQINDRAKATSKFELVAEHGKLGILYAIATEIFKVSTPSNGNSSPINSDNRN